MINKLLKVKFTDSFNKLSVNFFYLILTNGINFVMPLLIVPILLKRLGIEKFGLVMTGQALMSFFVLITEYNFNNTGTQFASIHRGSVEKLEEIFSRVLTTKFFLLVATFFLLYSIITVYPKFYHEKEFFLMSYGMVIGKSITPIWFFQGIEKMKFIALSNLIAKLILTTTIILVVNDQSDYIYVNLIYSIGDMIAGIISIIIVNKTVGITIRISSYKYVIEELKSGWQIFLSSLSINTYVNSNIIILGALTNNNIAGIYSIAEKTMLLLKQLASVFLQASFPHACKLAIESDKSLKSFLKKEFYLFSVIFFVLGLVMFLQAENICLFFSDKIIEETVNYIKILSIVPLIVSINMPVYQVFIIYEIKKELLLINSLAAASSLLLNFTLVPYFSGYGTVISILFTEILVTISLYMLIKTKYNNLFFI